MNYTLLKDALDMVRDFENHTKSNAGYSQDVKGYRQWIVHSFQHEVLEPEPVWEGKDKGRSPESVINTFIVHMNRYAKKYSRSAIYNSEFSTQEDFIYLITLKAFGAMTKMELIKKNIHDKPAGMQIINRLIAHGWVQQMDSETDKRSKVVHITPHGLTTLDKQMVKIRQATQIVTGDLTYDEKMQLIRLLHKLDNFHHPIYCKNIEPAKLLDMVVQKSNPLQ